MRKLFVSSVLLAVLLAVCVSSALTNEPKTSKLVQETKSRCTRITYEARRDKKQLKMLTRNGSSFQEAAGPGTRCPRLTSGPRTGEFLPNTPPKVGLSSSTAYLIAGPRSEVKLKAIACDREDENLLYVYSTTGGRITGDGANTTWDLTGVVPGNYFATVEVDDGCGCVTHETAQVEVASAR